MTHCVGSKSPEVGLINPINLTNNHKTTDHKDLHKTLPKSRIGKYSMMNEFHSNTKIDF